MNQITIETIPTKTQLFEDALRACLFSIDAIKEKTNEALQSFHKSQFEKFDKQILEILETLDAFVRLSSVIKNSLRENYHFSLKDLSPFIKLQFNILNILKKIAKARKSNDLILLLDLFEYELGNNLKKFKIEVLPAFARALNDNPTLIN
ncbi:MAG: hypothetical protein DRQ88_05170 [Epsilonproteobacteria bacterium]|nr:MAG: hypothetical protein DRQ89_04585 [Campylobacterota bacterium]RLA66819.1 MAG: hypothetical protein DRQ88_05170 [Campylobacterota bacterium]